MRRAVPTLGLFDAFDAPAPKPLPPRPAADPATAAAPATAPEEAGATPPPAAEPPRSVQGVTAEQSLRQSRDMVERVLGLLERIPAQSFRCDAAALVQKAAVHLVEALKALDNAFWLHDIALRLPGSTTPCPAGTDAPATDSLPRTFPDWPAADAWLRDSGYTWRHGGGYEAAGRPWIKILDLGDNLVAMLGAAAP